MGHSEPWFIPASGPSWSVCAPGHSSAYRLVVASDLPYSCARASHLLLYRFVPCRGFSSPGFSFPFLWLQASNPGPWIQVRFSASALSVNSVSGPVALVSCFGPLAPKFTLQGLLSSWSLLFWADLIPPILWVPDPGSCPCWPPVLPFSGCRSLTPVHILLRHWAPSTVSASLMI